MSKFRKQDSTETLYDVTPTVQPPEIQEVAVETHQPSETAVAVAATVSEQKMTLEMYCSFKGVPGKHRAGMRAFTKTIRATTAEWDSIFRNY